MLRKFSKISSTNWTSLFRWVIVIVPPHCNYTNVQQMSKLTDRPRGVAIRSHRNKGDKCDQLVASVAIRADGPSATPRRMMHGVETRSTSREGWSTPESSCRRGRVQNHVIEASEGAVVTLHKLHERLPHMGIYTPVMVVHSDSCRCYGPLNRSLCNSNSKFSAAVSWAQLNCFYFGVQFLGYCKQRTFP